MHHYNHSRYDCARSAWNLLSTSYHIWAYMQGTLELSEKPVLVEQEKHSVVATICAECATKQPDSD